jgi:cell division transport system permease protein
LMYELAAVLRETWLNLRSKQSAILVTLLMVSLSFVVFDTFLVITWNIRTILGTEQENVGIEAFLSDSVDEQSARALADVVAGMEGIRSVYYVSPEEAEALFRAELPDKADLLDLMGSEFSLPASFQISLLDEYRTEERIAALAGTLGRLDGVTEVVWGENYLPGLNKVVDSLQRLDIFAGLVLILSISLVVANTCRLAVARRALTVEVMSVFGASDWFLQGPFLLEGVATGFLGSAGGLVLTAAASAMVSASVAHTFLPARWIIGVLLLGALTGFTGSWLGLRSGIPRPRR